jgi:hypothetical protein
MNIKALRITTFTKLILFTALLLSVAMPLINTQKASAVTASDWKPGRIIDDAVFYNKNSMSASQIQQFLDAKLPICDRNRASSNPSYQPPWTCLKEYQENTTTRENNIGRFNANGTPYQVPGGKSSAQIIWDVAQEYGINPQVLIVMLQKEQGLITDNWPWQVQYQKAMGYACPDTAPCDTQYYGFYNQVSSAAWQLKRYIANPNSYNFKAGVTRYIQYSPNASCGGSQVYIENPATAALYNYTPYQPNAGALANLYGSADCGAYGNRNFWRYFNDWFGASVGVLPQNYAVWRLYNPNSNGHFFTASAIEATQYMGAGWKNDGIVLRNDPTGTPVYRLWNGKYHFYTADASERDLYIRAGWKNDGEVFKSATSGAPVYRLWSGRSHIMTADLIEVDRYVNAGWKNDGIVFYQLTNEVFAVWRLYNPNSNGHFFTASAIEATQYMGAGWKNDGIVLRNDPTGTPVYRLWNGKYHFYTADASERDLYIRAGWKNDGEVFKSATSGAPVYRLWSGRSHIMTADLIEVDRYVNAGWKNDGIVFYSNNLVVARRIIQPSSSATIVTPDISKLWALAVDSWVDDRPQFYVSKSTGVPIYELYNNNTLSYFYSSKLNEVSSYVSSGWINNGIAFYTLNNGKDVYRLYNTNSQKHILASNTTEINNLVSNGWVNDGVVFKASK